MRRSHRARLFVMLFIPLVLGIVMLTYTTYNQAAPDGCAQESTGCLNPAALRHPYAQAGTLVTLGSLVALGLFAYAPRLRARTRRSALSGDSRAVASKEA